MDYNKDIYTYGFCKECKKVVTPLVKLTREYFNYSASKYFKFILFNHDIRNRNDKQYHNLMKFPEFASNECNHLIYKEISRIFVTNIGVVKFSYEHSPLYLIDSGPLSEKDVKFNKNVLFII